MGGGDDFSKYFYQLDKVIEDFENLMLKNCMGEQNL